jgi:POT family proton-dependent oligopeptide transporter
MEKIALVDIKDDVVRNAVKRSVETNLVENAKSFLGTKISTLYDFFMLFVVMSGVSAVILFILSRKLLSMMHGVR